MLDLLVKYARDQGMTPEPGFAPKTVRWAITCDAKGDSHGVVELGDATQKRNPGQEFPKCPDLSQMELVSGSETKCHFLIESADVVALYLRGDEDEKKLAKTRDKHGYFVRLLREASSSMSELGLFARLLDDPAGCSAIADELKQHKARPADRVTLAIPGRTPSFLVESSAWHDWWRSFRSGLKQADAGRRTKPPPPDKPMRDLVTGELAQPVPTHPKIKGLADVGGLATGDALVCYDKEAFRSYGLQQSANGAVSEEAATAYREGLNQLIRDHSHRLAGAKVVHWFKHRVKKEDDPFAFLEEPPEAQELNAQQRAKELLDAIRTGQRPDLHENHYYALTLSGAAGRVMVRDWMEGQFEELAANIGSWFDDLAIIRRDGTGLAPAPKLMAVLGSTVRDLKDLPAPFVAKMWHVAVRREPIPQHALAQALARARVDIIDPKTVPNHARMGLMRAYHVRKGDRLMQPCLNEHHPEPAYHCGRLMAVLASVQYAALGDVGAGVVQRFYAAASATPALVLGRLTRTSQFHLNKLEPGLAHWYENKIAGIWAAITDRLPATLSLEEQSLFALGYYHQMAADRSKKTDTTTTKEKETSNE